MEYYDNKNQVSEIENSVNFIAQIKRFGMLMHRVHPENDINPSLFHTLFTIFKIQKQDGAGVSVGKITSILEQTKPAMSQRLNVLEERDYIIRVQSKSDRRKMDVIVTKKGEQLIKDMDGTMNQYLLKLNKKMSQDKIELLTTLLGEAVEHMQNIMKEEN